MNRYKSDWLCRRNLRNISLTILFFFTFNILSMSLQAVPGLERYIGTAIADAAVADKDGLGLESYWNYFSNDMNGGWSYSANTFTGNLVIQKNLLDISGRGTGLHESLTYNSLSSATGVVGKGWQLGNDLFIQENADDSVTYKDEDATNHTFTKNADGTYTAPAGVYYSLTKLADGSFNLESTDNSIYHFENGIILSIADEKGNTTTFTYDSSNRLTEITDASGRKLTYSYDAVSGKLKTITDPANRTVSFSYDSYGYLNGVTEANGVKTTIYSLSGRISYILVPDTFGSQVTWFTWIGYKLNSISDARAQYSNQYVTKFTYDTTLLKTTVTDPANHTTTYVHNTNGNLIQLQDGVGNSISYNWSNNNLEDVNDANGTTSADYDSNGNVNQVIDSLNESSNATTDIDYDSKNNPTQVTDANNNQFTASYDNESNLISSTNTQRREADANTYDAFGNITSETETGAPTYNLLENSNFEWNDASGFVELWGCGGDTNVISTDSTVSLFGNKSIKFDSQSSVSSYVYQHVSVTPGEKLTLAAPFRMQDISGTGGIDIGLEYYDADGNYLNSRYSDTWAGTGNSKAVVTDTVPTGAAHAYVILELWEASGTVWFDGVQLEKPIANDEGHIITDFDYSENSSFENGLDYWATTGNPGDVSLTTEAAWGGTKSVKINLANPGSASIESPYIPVRAGEPLTVSGFIKSVDLNGDGAYLQTDFYDQNYTYLGTDMTSKQTGTQDFTRYAKAITPPVGTAYVVILGTSSATSGVTYFDNIKLIPRATTVLEYDPAGNYLTDAIDPLGNWTSCAYDAVGNRTMFSDPKGNATSFSYDNLNNLTSVTDAMSKVFRFGYDLDSMQIAYRDGRSSSSTDNTYSTFFSYNKLDQISLIIDPLNRWTSYYYDTASNLSEISYPSGKRVYFSYDAADRLTKKYYSAETTQYNFSYDNANNLLQVSDDKARNYSYSYDKANRLTSATDLYGYSQNYEMDSVGNVVYASDSNGKAISYNFGSANQLLSLTDTLGNQTLFRYDETGRPFEIIKGNGFRNNLRYDQAGRIAEIADLGNPGGVVLQYDYDANGNITDMTTVDGLQSFSYDALNRLTGWTDEAGTLTSFEYDAVGNLTKKGNRTFTYNAANEITNSGFSYDSNGNLTADDKYNYFYDTENHLVKVTKIADGTTVATYEYDYRSLRISKTTADGTIRYHWDSQEHLVRESDTNGNTLAQYIYDDKGNLQAIEKGGEIYYTHTNHRGDILAITDANGNQVATYKYSPWGELLESTGSFEQPFRYAGYYFDSETGMYYLKARYYSPELGRFLTKDTFEGFNADPQSLNLYAYANGNPVMNVDPSGHWSKTINLNKSLSGAYLNGSLKFTSTSSKASIALSLKYNITYGAIGMTVGSLVTGMVLSRAITSWIITNTFSKQLLVGAFGAALGGIVYNGGVKLITNIVKKPFKYLENLVIKIPGATKSIKSGSISESFSFNY